MWTASLTNKHRKEDKVFVEITYTDGTNTFVKGHRFSGNVTISDVQSTARNEIAKLNKLDTNFDTLSEGKVDITAPAPDDPTQEQLDAAQWEADFNKLRKGKLLVDLGIIASDSPAYVNLKTKVANNFQISYLDLIQI